MVGCKDKDGENCDFKGYYHIAKLAAELTQEFKEDNAKLREALKHIGFLEARTIVGETNDDKLSYIYTIVAEALGYKRGSGGET